jgi:hypothetical protein
MHRFHQGAVEGLQNQPQSLQETASTLSGFAISRIHTGGTKSGRLRLYHYRYREVVPLISVGV